MQLRRYLPDGTLDPTFGAGGIADAAVAVSAATLVVHADGRIVAAGIAANPFQEGRRIVAARFLADGTLDAT